MTRSTKKHPAASGGKWCRNEKRLAIYLRDGIACAYCGSGVEDGTPLQLDHVIPHSHGGSNHENNLITACRKCNTSRGNRSVRVFAEAAANYTNDRTAKQIVNFITRQTAQPINRKHAKEILAKRLNVLDACKQEV